MVDPPAAEIVRRIFDLREKGEGLQAIADRLTAENVLTPRDYAFGRSGHPWGRESVRAILGNEAYIGNLVQLKQGSLSYKDRRQRCRPPETWVRIDGTHQPLVDRQTWDTVRALEKNGYQPRRVKRADLFLGLLFCACCQKALTRTVNRKFRGGEWREYTYYICRSHVCIGADALRELLLRELRAHFALLMPQREEIAAEIKSDIEMKWRETHQRELREKAAHEKRLWELDRLLGRLYEDRMKEELSQETYQALLARYERERTTLREALEGVKALGMPLGIEGKDMEEWFTPQTVSPEQLKAFIEKIEVGKEGGLQIHYSFEEPVLL